MRSLLLATAAALLPAAFATYGVDISQPISADTAKCMVQNSRTFGIVRAWCSYGGFDSNAPASVANMWAGGMAHVDVYMFPCAGQDPTSQANSLVDQLSSHGVKYGMIWLDIESNPSPGCGWAENFATPRAFNRSDGTVTAPMTACSFVGTLKSALRAKGVNVGTYASSYEWSITVGSGCSDLSDTPIWYPHYDGEANYNDWASFGGWKTPSIKQYSGTGTLCGAGVDWNWYP